MTREARLAAGWVECWGLFDWSDGKWMASPRWAVAPKRRNRYSFEEAQKQVAGPCWTPGTRIVVRRFWRRKKPKPAPPPLAVGDEVVVRGKVVAVNTPPGALCNVAVELRMPPGRASSRYFAPDELERVKP